LSLNFQGFFTRTLQSMPQHTLRLPVTILLVSCSASLATTTLRAVMARRRGQKTDVSVSFWLL